MTTKGTEFNTLQIKLKILKFKIRLNQFIFYFRKSAYTVISQC